MSLAPEAAGMVWIKPKYLIEDTDRHGNQRLYVRKPGQKKVRVLAEPNTPAFWAAYSEAVGLAAPQAQRKIELRAERVEASEEGTLGWLCARYFESAPFKALDVTTRQKRRGILESCLKEAINPKSERLFSTVRCTSLTIAGLEVLRDRKASAFPEAANGRVKALRTLFKWAIKAFPQHVRSNPTIELEQVKNPSQGHHTWTPDEVRQYLLKHGPGSAARRALVFFMFTGARISDVVRFGRQHLFEHVDPETGLPSIWIRFTAYKNRKRKPVHLQLPVLPPLAAEIAATPAGQLTFLVTQWGRPFTTKGFGNRMRKWFDDADLPHCSAHGLRKAAATFAAENGATEAQLNSLFGWTDPKMAAHYTRSARQKLLAGKSMNLITLDCIGNEIVPPSAPMEKSGTITGKKPKQIKSG